MHLAQDTYCHLYVNTKQYKGFFTALNRQLFYENINCGHTLERVLRTSTFKAEIRKKHVLPNKAYFCI